ncbi:hypothetical protein Patl1_02105 [Pistacia atlantica]|uniref:Uncharacterized protein n=1 Tax=Pistacia atlantica TaxID=434234 RepID=A0ACC1C7P1_9ROSI|nr:hypothetical protein Patl1_02105 [Pistacia atlantica]
MRLWILRVFAEARKYIEGEMLLEPTPLKIWASKFCVLLIHCNFNSTDKKF